MSSVVRVHPPPRQCGSSSFGRAKAFQALGSGFEPRLPLKQESRRSSVVEHFLGKEGVTSSTLVAGSIFVDI